MTMMESILAHGELIVRIKHDQVRIISGGKSSLSALTACQPGWLFRHPSRNIR